MAIIGAVKAHIAPSSSDIQHLIVIKSIIQYYSAALYRSLRLELLCPIISPKLKPALHFLSARLAELVRQKQAQNSFIRSNPIILLTCFMKFQFYCIFYYY